VRVRVLLSPIVAGVSSRPALVERLIEACGGQGLPVVGANVMHLEDGTRTHFFSWLADRHPELVGGYEQLYQGRNSPPAAYRSEVARVVRLAQDRLSPHGHAIEGADGDTVTPQALAQKTLSPHGHAIGGADGDTATPQALQQKILSLHRDGFR